MGRRFVKQPNGLFALFSSITDSFHNMNMNAPEAVNFAVAVHGYSKDGALDALDRAKADETLERWPEALAAIEHEHGIRERIKMERYGAVEVATCGGCGWSTVSAGLVPAGWADTGDGLRCELCGFD